MSAPALPDAFLARPIAHRALHDSAHGVIENSMSAVRAAMARGYGVELDLQLSSDGVPMVFHDATLERLTHRKGEVHRMLSEVLRGMSLRGGRDFIPTLPQVLAEVRGRIPILLELKDQGARDTGQLERATAQALARYRGPVAVMSFNPRMVGRLAKMAPAIPRGLTTGRYDADFGVEEPLATHLREIADFDAVGARFISHQAADLSRPRVAELKAQGVPILCWTIKSAEAEAEARKVADNVTFEGYVPPEA